MFADQLVASPLGPRGEIIEMVRQMRAVCNLSFHAARVEIDAAMQRAGFAPKPQPAPVQKKTNQYAGTCWKCKQHVAVGSGMTFADGTLKSGATKWTVEHLTCPPPLPFGAKMQRRPADVSDL